MTTERDRDHLCEADNSTELYASAVSAVNDVALLTQRAAEGDARAWECLVEQYGRLIWSITRDFQLAQSDAADVFQTTWLRLVESIQRIEHPDRVGSWLAATARNECLRSLAARKRVVLFRDDELLQGRAAASGLVVDDSVFADERQVVRDALSQLPRRQRQVLSLTVDGYSPADIAAELGIEANAVRVHLHHARAKVRAQMSDTEGLAA